MIPCCLVTPAQADIMLMQARRSMWAESTNYLMFLGSLGLNARLEVCYLCFCQRPACNHCALMSPRRRCISAERVWIFHATWMGLAQCCWLNVGNDGMKLLSKNNKHVSVDTVYSSRFWLVWPRILQDVIAFEAVRAACVSWIGWNVLGLPVICWQIPPNGTSLATMVCTCICLCACVTGLGGLGWAYRIGYNYMSLNVHGWRRRLDSKETHISKEGQREHSSAVFAGVTPHVMPITLLGSGRAGLPNKFFNLVHALKLECAGSVLWFNFSLSLVRPALDHWQSMNLSVILVCS